MEAFLPQALRGKGGAVMDLNVRGQHSYPSLA